MTDKIVRVEVIRRFRLSEYEKVFNIKRVDNKQDYNRFIVGDRFDCSIDFCKYLMEGTKVVKVIEVRQNDVMEMA